MIQEISRGLVVLGCGNMGQALVEGWVEDGLDPQVIWVIEPNPSTELRALGLRINRELPSHPWGVLVAVKPQMLSLALPQVAHLGNGSTLFVSIAAGTTLATFEGALGADTPVIRTMPNTPAAIGQGVTAIVGNANASDAHLAGAERLLNAVGSVVRVETEAQIDAVTGVSGSGPAYVFHLIETLTEAGVAQGLPRETASHLAKATVAGAGALALQSETDPAQLRVNVTSPNGTTQAALEVLMNPNTGFPALVPQAVAAAVKRAQELAKGA